METRSDMSERRACTSASSLYRRAGCPGSELAEMYQPKELPNKAAELGVLKHWYDANPEIKIEEIEHVDHIEANRRLRENFLAAQLPHYGLDADARHKVIKQVRFNLRDEAGELVIGPDGLPFSGEPDIAYFYPDARLLVIFDSKFGRLPVPLAAKNAQLRSYVVIMADPDHGEFEVERAVAAITQPFVSPPVHAVEYDVDQIRQAKAEILMILRGARTGHPERIASPEWCFGCRAAGSCKEAIAMFSMLAVQNLKEMPPEKLEHLLMAVVPGVLNVAEKIKERLTYIGLNYPHLLKSMEMVDVAPSKVIETANAVSAFGSIQDLVDANEFIGCCEVSRAKLAKKIARKKEMALDEAEALLADRLGDNLTARPRNKQLRKKK